MIKEYPFKHALYTTDDCVSGELPDDLPPEDIKDLADKAEWYLRPERGWYLTSLESNVKERIYFVVGFAIPAADYFEVSESQDVRKNDMFHDIYVTIASEIDSVLLEDIMTRLKETTEARDRLARATEPSHVELESLVKISLQEGKNPNRIDIARQILGNKKRDSGVPNKEHQVRDERMESQPKRRTEEAETENPDQGTGRETNSVETEQILRAVALLWNQYRRNNASDGKDFLRASLREIDFFKNNVSGVFDSRGPHERLKIISEDKKPEEHREDFFTVVASARTEIYDYEKVYQQLRNQYQKEGVLRWKDLPTYKRELENIIKQKNPGLNKKQQYPSLSRKFDEVYTSIVSEVESEVAKQAKEQFKVAINPKQDMNKEQSRISDVTNVVSSIILGDNPVDEDYITTLDNETEHLERSEIEEIASRLIVENEEFIEKLVAEYIKDELSDAVRAHCHQRLQEITRETADNADEVQDSLAYEKVDLNQMFSDEFQGT